MRKFSVLLVVVIALCSVFAGCAYKKFDESSNIVAGLELRMDENTLLTLQSTYALLLDSYEQIAAIRAQAVANGLEEEAARLKLDMAKREARLTTLRESITLLADSIEAARRAIGKE